MASAASSNNSLPYIRDTVLHIHDHALPLGRSAHYFSCFYTQEKYFIRIELLSLISPKSQHYDQTKKTFYDMFLTAAEVNSLVPQLLQAGITPYFFFLKDINISVKIAEKYDFRFALLFSDLLEQKGFIEAVAQHFFPSPSFTRKAITPPTFELNLDSHNQPAEAAATTMKTLVQIKKGVEKLRAPLDLHSYVIGLG